MRRLAGQQLSKTTQDLLISVVLPIYNRRKSTHFAFSELMLTSLDRCEIVVSDNSDDYVRLPMELELSREIGQKNAFQLLRNLPSIGAPRNLFIGINAARGSWILLTNSHTLMHPQTIAEIRDWIQSTDAEGRHVGFLEFNGHPAFKAEFSGPRISYIDAGIESAIYGFNRGSSMAGVIFKRNSINHSLYRMDAGIYPHVPFITDIAYRTGCFSFFSSIPVFNGELSYAHGIHENCERPACLGLCELIRHAHEFTVSNDLACGGMQDHYGIIWQKRFFVRSRINEWRQNAENARIDSFVRELRKCCSELPDVGWLDVVNKIIEFSCN